MKDDRTDHVRPQVGQYEPSGKEHQPGAVLSAGQIPDRAEIGNRVPSIWRRAVFCGAKVLANACRIQAC
jgi:hypothetical protein